MLRYQNVRNITYPSQTDSRQILCQESFSAIMLVNSLTIFLSFIT